MKKLKFRKKALEHVTYSEQSNDLIRLVSPFDWIFLSTIWIMLSAFIIWSIFGTIPTRVAGEGILLASNASIFDAEATLAARLVSITVNPGQYVKQGETIAYLDAPDMQKQVDVAVEYLQKLREQYSSLKTKSIEEEKERQTLLLKKQNLLQNNIKIQQDQLKAVSDLLQRKIDLEKKAFLTREEVLRTQNDLYASKQHLQEYYNQLIQNQEVFENFKEEWHQRLLTLELQVIEAQNNVNKLQYQLTLSKTVKSPIAGIVTYIQASIGDILKPGDSVASIATMGEGLDAIIYVPVQDGQRIHKGTSVLVSPENIEREIYGSLVGQVISVSNFPSTEESMLATLHNKELVTRFTKAGIPVAVRVRIQTNSKTFSGYQWSSGQGPNQKILPGLVVYAQMTVRHIAPLSLIMPTLRKWWEGRV